MSGPWVSQTQEVRLRTWAGKYPKLLFGKGFLEAAVPCGYCPRQLPLS